MEEAGSGVAVMQLFFPLTMRSIGAKSWGIYVFLLSIWLDNGLFSWSVIAPAFPSQTAGPLVAEEPNVPTLGASLKLSEVGAHQILLCPGEGEITFLKRTE